MAVLIALCLILFGGLGTLAAMAYATRGDAHQPYDVVPYVSVPGDLDENGE